MNMVASTSEREHKVGKSTVDIALYMSVGQLIYAFEEGKNLAVVLKESYYGFVESCELLVRLIASGIMCRAAIEHISSAIARTVLRNALTVRETEYTYSKSAVFGISMFEVAYAAVGPVGVQFSPLCVLASHLGGELASRCGLVYTVGFRVDILFCYVVAFHLFSKSLTIYTDGRAVDAPFR